MRAVLDANVLVSAALTPAGPPGQLITAWRAGRFQLIASATLLSEVAKVTTRRKLATRIAASERDGLLNMIGRQARLVPDQPIRHGDVPDDPADDYLVALAEEWHAALVTGDRHLLTLPGMPAIMTPAQFLSLLSRRTQARRSEGDDGFRVSRATWGSP